MSDEPTEMSASPETRIRAAEELADRCLAPGNEPDAGRRRRTIVDLAGRAPMVIVAGHVTVDPAQRESYLAGSVSVLGRGGEA